MILYGSILQLLYSTILPAWLLLLAVCSLFGRVTKNTGVVLPLLRSLLSRDALATSCKNSLRSHCKASFIMVAKKPAERFDFRVIGNVLKIKTVLNSIAGFTRRQDIPIIIGLKA